MKNPVDYEAGWTKRVVNPVTGRVPSTRELVMFDPLVPLLTFRVSERWFDWVRWDEDCCEPEVFLVMVKLLRGAHQASWIRSVGGALRLTSGRECL